jgi:cytoskeletal protein RodZ
MASFGESLKRERELREITLRQISEATKINLRYLEALEQNRFDALPGGLFNKGFIRAYAKYIGIDGEAMVDSYLVELKSRMPGGEAAPARGRANLHRPQELPQRRSGPVTKRAAAISAIANATATAPAPRRMREAPPPSAGEAEAASAPAPPHGKARPVLAKVETAVETPSHPAVSGIEDVDAQAPASSRALVWVMSLVAAAGVLFLIVSMVRGRVPGAQHPQEPVVTAGAPDPAPGAATASQTPPPADDPAQPVAPDGSVVVPETTPQSTLLAGAAPTQPAKKATPAPAAKRSTPPPPLSTPPESPVIADTRSDDSAVPQGPMKVVIEARARAYVVLICDGREVVNRMMEAGETEKAKCDSQVRVSASDAGAVGLSVNGNACLPLGDPGTRAYGYTIRIDDFARICPAPTGGQHGRH